MITLVLPDAISDLKLLPQPILNRIRSELCAGDVVLEAPSQISLFTYDNDTFCVYPYACDENAAAQQIRVRVKGIATELYSLENEKFRIKPLYVDHNETLFEIYTEPGEFSFYGIRWAENRYGEKIEEEWGSAPHDFED